MENIALSQKVDFKKGDGPNQGIITVEPFYPGYGMTLGNSLRRVLLSSLPGSAVVGVKMKGVSHEFMTLPNVKEDILEIILNLKTLRLKVHSDEEIKLELDAHGEKQVKAGDITKNSQAEIINPDLVLANITDMAGSLNMEIYASKGRGYRPVEAIEEKKSEIGYIEVDAIFSPVLSVGIKVENVRVGKMTNWDKLILDIKTDGTITPQESFEQAVKILIDQFGALIGKKGEKSTSAPSDAKALAGKKASADKAEKDKEKDKEEKKEKDDKKEKDESKEKKEEESASASTDTEAMADEEEKPKKKRGRPKKVE